MKTSRKALETAKDRISPLTSSAVFLLTVLLAFACVYAQRGPAPVSSSAPPTDFSSGRAIQHLEAIAKQPRPMGSPAHAEARGYILKELSEAGLTAQVQETTAINVDSANVDPAPLFTAGRVANVVAKLEGKNNTKAVLISGHYDSVPYSPGASDDGSAVAVMLETLRALKAGAPLNNDVIFLFTDGEEVGLLGAGAFVDEHPWAKDVGLVLNFEARGNSGPALMFETSDDNGWLIDEFAKSADYPITNSLMYEIYKLLPNDTDLTVFKRAGLPGLNFAYIGGLLRYHSRADNIENASEHSIQHEGSYALSLTRHFANVNLENTREANAVYFNLFGPLLIHYSVKWVIPLMALVIILFVAVIALGFRRKRLSVLGILAGFIAFLLNMLIAGMGAGLIWRLIRGLHAGYGANPLGDTYNSEFYILSFIALTIALTSALGIWCRKRISLENLTVGALLWWAILMVLTSSLLKGASFLFTWPLLFALIGFAYMLNSKDQEDGSIRRLAVSSLLAIPGILLLAPIIYLVFTGLTVRASGVVMMIVVLVLGLLLPQLSIIAASSRWLLPSASALIGVALIAGGSLSYGFNDNNARANNLFYGLNADTGNAIWASIDERPDEWTSQFFTEGTPRVALNEFSLASSNGFMTAPATAVSLAAPSISIIEDKKDANSRRLRMRISSPRLAVGISLFIEPGAEIIEAAIDGKRINQDNLQGSHRVWGGTYYVIPSDGIDLMLEIKPDSSLHLTVVDISYGLPDLRDMALQERPAYMMPSIYYFSDSTLVSKTYSF
jgi:hypothetical protein